MNFDDALLLRRIANTVIANITTHNRSKLTISLFLYRLSEYLHMSPYKNVANSLIKESFADIEKSVSSKYSFTLAEIGIGLIRLINNNFLEDSLNSEILYEIDKAVFSDKTDILAPNIYSPTLYLLYRLKYYPRNFNKEYGDFFISRVLSYKDEKFLLFSKDPITLCGLLYLCMELKYGLNDKCIEIELLIKKFMILLNHYEKDSIAYNRIAYYYLIKTIDLIPSQDKLRLTLNTFMQNLWALTDDEHYYFDSWIIDLLNIRPLPLSNTQKVDLEKKIRDSYYDLTHSSERLTGVGMNILTNINIQNERNN